MQNYPLTSNLLMMDWKLICKLTVLLALFCNKFGYAQTDSIKIDVNDTTVFWHKIVWVQNDTINGKRIAVFEKNKSVEAVIQSYKNSKPDGTWKKYYPSGQLMEKISYSEGVEN